MSGPMGVSMEQNGTGGANGRVPEFPSRKPSFPPHNHIAKLLEELQVPFEAPLVKVAR